jgi:hypothetical protein
MHDELTACQRVISLRLAGRSVKWMMIRSCRDSARFNTSLSAGLNSVTLRRFVSSSQAERSRANRAAASSQAAVSRGS